MGPRRLPGAQRHLLSRRRLRRAREPLLDDGEHRRGPDLSVHVRRRPHLHYLPGNPRAAVPGGLHPAHPRPGLAGPVRRDRHGDRAPELVELFVWPHVSLPPPVLPVGPVEDSQCLPGPPPRERRHSCAPHGPAVHAVELGPADGVVHRVGLRVHYPQRPAHGVGRRATVSHLPVVRQRLRHRALHCHLRGCGLVVLLEEVPLHLLTVSRASRSPSGPCATAPSS